MCSSGWGRNQAGWRSKSRVAFAGWCFAFVVGCGGQSRLTVDDVAPSPTESVGPPASFSPPASVSPPVPAPTQSSTPEPTATAPPPLCPPAGSPTQSAPTPPGPPSPPPPDCPTSLESDIDPRAGGTTTSNGITIEPLQVPTYPQPVTAPTAGSREQHCGSRHLCSRVCQRLRTSERLSQPGPGPSPLPVASASRS